MAADPRLGWPIRHDHCFMRVCLDAAVGRRWHEAIRRPATRHAPDAVLARAVALAERVRDAPDRLAALDAASRAMRRAGSSAARYAAPSTSVPSEEAAARSFASSEASGSARRRASSRYDAS